MKKHKKSTDKKHQKTAKKDSRHKSVHLLPQKRPKAPHETRQEKFQAWVDTLPEFEIEPKTWEFWRDSFLIFIIGSFVGHFFEYILSIGLVEIHPGWTIAPTPLIAEPFGLGMMAIMWIIYPLVKKHKLGTFGTYIAGALLATTIEFVCAAVIVVVLGSNPYWDYTEVTRFNLYGFVCLHNGLLFGVGALGTIYYFYPAIAKWIDRIGNKIVNPTAIILAIWYVASLACSFFFGFRIIL